MFINMREKVVRWEDCLEEHDEIPDCAVSIYGFHPSVKKNLVSVLQNISEWQKISDLYIEGLHCYHETEPILLDLHENTQSMTLMNCILPQNVLRDIVQELSQSNKLIRLDLSNTSLCDAEHHLIESIRSWGPDPPLHMLDLRDCMMSEGVCDSLLKALLTCKHLTHS